MLVFILRPTFNSLMQHTKQSCFYNEWFDNIVNLVPDAEMLKRKRQRLFESNGSRRIDFFRDNIFESELFQIHLPLFYSLSTSVVLYQSVRNFCRFLGVFFSSFHFFHPVCFGPNLRSFGTTCIYLHLFSFFYCWDLNVLRWHTFFFSSHVSYFSNL